MRLETIRLLADNGSPLEITLEVRENDMLVTRERTTLQEQLSTDPLGDLKRALAHYPREVQYQRGNAGHSPLAGTREHHSHRAQPQRRDRQGRLETQTHAGGENSQHRV